MGVLTQGRLPPEPRFTLPPCSRTGPRGRERGFTLRGGGPLTREQLLLTRQEREQQVLSTCWAPPVPTSPTLPWPRSFANPPAASGWRKAPGDNPRLRNRLEGQGGRWSPASGQTSGLGTGATKGFDIFSCPRLGLGVLPHLSLPAWSSSSPDLVLGLKVNPSPAALSQHPGPSAGSACPPAAPGYLCFI